MKANDRKPIRREPNPKKDFYRILGGVVFLILITLFLLMFPIFGQSLVLKVALAMAYALVFWQLFGIYMKRKDQL